MKTQRLHCENGNHEWDRVSQRGRRPHSCPAHAATPSTDESTSDDNGISDTESTPPVESAPRVESYAEQAERLTMTLASLATKERVVVVR